jgi:hypothetical protein
MQHPDFVILNPAFKEVQKLPEFEGMAFASVSSRREVDDAPGGVVPIRVALPMPIRNIPAEACRIPRCCSGTTSGLRL